MFDITPIIQIIVLAVLIVCTAYLIPYWKSKTSQGTWSEIVNAATAAVKAAEQIFKGTGRGEEKKAYVLSWLQQQGLTVDLEKLDVLIEQAVYELNNSIRIAGSLIHGDGENEASGT